MEPDKTKALDRMMRLCSTGERCRSDIIKKLDGCGLPASDVSDIVEKLCRDGYIDETRYADAFVHDKSVLQGWGANKIRMALRQKRIDDRAITSAFEDMDREGAESKLLAVIKAKWKSLDGEADIKKKQAKLLRFALGRGYDYSEIKDAYEKIVDNI